MYRRLAMLLTFVLAIGGCAGAASSPSPAASIQATLPSNLTSSSPLSGITLAQAELPRASADPAIAASAADDIDAFGIDLLRAIAVVGTPSSHRPASPWPWRWRKSGPRVRRPFR